MPARFHARKYDEEEPLPVTRDELLEMHKY